jgi:catechol 2,3-dioxygenase
MAATRLERTRSKLIARIGRVDLRVRGIDSSLAFYRDIVGLEVASRDGVRAELRAPGGPVIVALNSEGVSLPAERGATGLFHVAIRFPTRSSLGDVLRRVAEAQMELGAADHLVSEALYVVDPDQNGIELYRDRPEEEWPEPTDDTIVPMDSLPLDLEGILDEGRGDAALGQSAAPGTDIGHLHLQISDLEPATRFYAEVLGLDLTGRLGNQAGFFSSNGYHHHIATNIWNSHGGSPASKDHAGLDRIVFEVDDEDQFENLKVRLGEFGVSYKENGRELTVEDADSIELRFALVS